MKKTLFAFAFILVGNLLFSQNSDNVKKATQPNLENITIALDSKLSKISEIGFYKEYQNLQVADYLSQFNYPTFQMVDNNFDASAAIYQKNVNDWEQEYTLQLPEISQEVEDLIAIKHEISK